MSWNGASPSAAVRPPRITASTATPSAPPTWRAAMFSPVAPANRCGATDSAAALDTPTLAAPMPTPSTSPSGSHSVRKCGVSVSATPMTTADAAISSAPTETSARGDGRRAARPM